MQVQVQVQVQVHVVALPFAFLIARVHIIWLVYCACTDQGTFLSACVSLGACACAFAGLYVVVFCTIRGFVRLFFIFFFSFFFALYYVTQSHDFF